MASNFLKRKAEEQAKKIDEKYGDGSYGGTSDLKQKIAIAKREKESSPTNNRGAIGGAASITGATKGIVATTTKPSTRKTHLNEYSAAVKQLEEKGVKNASGIMTKGEWARRNNATGGGGTYQDYLTSQIQKYGEGNLDLTKRPKYKNPDGTISTVDSFSINENGKEVLLPTIVWGADGKPKRLTEDEAIKHYRATGEYLGKFNSVDEANTYAKKLHQQQALDYLNPEDVFGANALNGADRIRTDRFSTYTEPEKPKEPPRDANFWDVTWNSVKRGYVNSRYGQESYYDMLGEDNDKRHYERMLENEYDYNFKPDNWFEGAVSGGMELLGQQAAQYLNGRTAAMVGTSAVGAFALGQMGPQVLAPEEVITVPGAMALAFAAGSASTNFEIEAGLAYNEMIEQGISHETASKIAMATGFGNAMLEIVQIDELLKGAKALEKSGVADNILKKVWNFIKSKAKSVGKETLEETAQELVTIGGVQAGSKIDNGEWAYGTKEVLSRLGQVAASSALSFGFLEGSKSVVGGATGGLNYGVNKHNTTQAVKTLNQNAETLNGYIEEEEGKIQPLPKNATPEEIVEKGKEIRATAAKLQNEVLARQNEQQTTAPTSLEEAAAEVVNKKKETMTAEEMLDELSKNGEKLTVGEVKRATGYGNAGSKIITDLTNNTEGKSFSQVKSEVENAYLAGYSNEDIQNMSPIEKEMNNAGKMDRIQDDVIANERAKDATIYDGAFHENEYTKDFTDDDKKMIATVAKILKMDVSAVDEIIANKDTGAEGNASHTDGKMEISANRQVEALVYKMVLHEGGHRMKQLSTKEWGVLMNALYQRAEQSKRTKKIGKAEQSLFDDVKAEHDEAGITMNTGGYVEEVAVRELETIFSSAEEFNKWWSEISQNQELKGNWQKLCAWISQVLEDLKKAWSQRKMTAEEKTKLAELERLRGLLADALSASGKAATEIANNKAQTVAENATTTEAKNGTETNEKTSSEQERVEDNKKAIEEEFATIENLESFKAHFKNVSVGERFLNEDTGAVIEVVSKNSNITTANVTLKNGYSEEILLYNDEAKKMASKYKKLKAEKSSESLENQGNKEYNGNVNYALKQWHTGLSKAQIVMVEKWIRRVGSPESKKIAEDTYWYNGRLDGKELFAIYSTEDADSPTILYLSRRKQAKLELGILMNLLEEYENGESIDGKSAYVSWVSGGGWVQQSNSNKNNFQHVGAGQNNQNVRVLPGQSKSDGSPAFWNVIEHCFGKQAEVNSKKAQQGKSSFSLKDSNNRLSPIAMENRINELREEISNIEDELVFSDDADEKKLNNRLVKLQYELDSLIAEERKAAVKTTLPKILDNLSKYRLSDLHSLAEQVSDGAWDNYEDLSRDELEFELRETIESRLADLSPEEQHEKRFGFSVRPVNDNVVKVDFGVDKALDNVGLQVDAKGKSVAPSFSLKTWNASTYVQDRETAIKAIVKATGVTKKDAERYIDNINSIARMIADDRVRLDYDSNIDDSATVLKSNSEYKWTVDMSTLCAKRLLTTGTFDAIQKALPNTVFDSDDIVNLRSMMVERGYEVACGICYVESTRRELGPITAEFIERYKESQKTGKPITRINSEGKIVDLKKTKEQMETTKDTSTDKFYADKNYTPTLAELNTTDIDIVKSEHPLVYEAYLNFMNARGQAKPKLLETRAEYKGEILKHFKVKTAVNARNKAGGLRVQSFSDFEVAHLIDMMQIVLDMSQVGLKSQAYTKVPAFADVFGGTGMKINLSLIAKDSGLDKNGNLIFDDVEGMPHDEAFRLRKKYSQNVGTILVGKNDAHIIAAMADDRIDFIIPFHKSSWKESLYDALGLTGYDDYTNFQNEKPINKEREIKNFQPSEYWDYSKTGEENAQTYLEMCKEDGRIPKFPQFQSYEGYWKLLIDFKMYDNEGAGSPQMVVQPEFDMNSANDILNSYEGGHRQLPVAQDVVDDFVEQHKNKGTNYSLKGGIRNPSQWKSEFLDTLEDLRDGKEGATSRLYKYVEEGTLSPRKYDALIEEYGVIRRGENPYRDVQVPKNSADGKKVSQTVRTILEAKVTPDEALPTIEKMVEDGVFSYDVYSDGQAVEEAEAYLKKHGWVDSLKDWFDSVEKGEVSKKITAMGWALYNNAANIAATTTSESEKKTAIDTSLNILDAMVRHQRSAAQALQATRILKKMSPETQLYGIQKSVSSFQKELTEKYGKKAPDLKIDKELAEEFLKAKTQEERYAAEAEIYKDIGRQMPSRFVDRWNAWRYLAMLGNLRTHGRNIIGNAGFAPVVIAKDLTATAIESVVYRVSGKRMVRGKSIIRGSKADRALLKAAWKDYANVAEIISNGGKYNDSAMANQNIEKGRKIFKSKLFAPVEWARKGNSWLLELEDVWFSKPHYVFALAQYCKANNISPEQINRGKAIGPAREYAIKEAQKATYKDTNAFSQTVSSIGRSGGKKNWVKKAGSFVIEGILPFRKTPANILVRGVEYSPIGFIKGISYDLVQVAKKNMSATEAIDHISAGLTGTGLLALGVYLAAQGLIRGHGEPEKDEKEFKELMGHQSYSLELPNGESVTLDWLAPEALPFFVGVNIWESTQSTGEEVNLSTILKTLTGITEPMLEMSCLQGVNDVLEGLGYASSNDTSALVAITASAITSYFTQGIPTLLGQIERTGEENRMSTYTEKNDFLTGDMQYTLGKISAKIPSWDYNQIPYIDAWGRKEASGTALKRGLNNFLNPAYTSTIETSDMEKELLRLYKQTGEDSVFPSRADKYFTVDSARKDLTADEYVRYATLKGEKSYKIITDLVKSSAYRSLNDREKVKAIEEAYDYANQKAKQAISNYTPETWVSKADNFDNVGNFLSFRSEVSSTRKANGNKISKEEVVDIIIDMAQNDSETWGMYLSMYDSKGDMQAYDKGIAGEDYMNFLESLAEVDKPSKSGEYGTYTQDEARKAINRMSGLTRSEKAVLWQSVNSSWKSKNNPYK